MLVKLGKFTTLGIALPATAKLGQVALTYK
jgi:hypothetical protein